MRSLRRTIIAGIRTIAFSSPVTILHFGRQ
jgi:hypothetical protein